MSVEVLLLVSLTLLFVKDVSVSGSDLDHTPYGARMCHRLCRRTGMCLAYRIDTSKMSCTLSFKPASLRKLKGYTEMTEWNKCISGEIQILSRSGRALICVNNEAIPEEEDIEQYL